MIFGSDWPHMEGLAEPREILTELDGLDASQRGQVLFANATGLNERRPA